MDHLKIAHKIHEQNAGKAPNCGTVENSHIKICELNSEIVTVKVHNIRQGKQLCPYVVTMEQMQHNIP